MSLNLSTRYPTQIDATDPDGYPFGKAKNVSAPGDGTGTPWEADLANDFLGFLQAILVAAGTTPNNTPDKADASQYLDSLLQIAGGFDEADFLEALDTYKVARLGSLGGRDEFNGSQFFDRAVGTRSKSLASLSGVVVLDWADSNTYLLPLTEDVVLTALNFNPASPGVPGAPLGAHQRVIVLQTAGGGFKVSDPSTNVLYKGAFDLTTKEFDVSTEFVDSITILDFTYCELTGTRYVVSHDLGSSSGNNNTGGGTPMPPAQPTGLGISGISESGMTLTWDVQGDADDFTLFYDTVSPVNVATAQSMTTMTNTLDVTGLTDTTDYFFVVRASNGDGDSPVSAEVTAQTSAPPAVIDLPDSGNPLTGDITDFDFSLSANGAAVAGAVFQTDGVIGKFGFTPESQTWATGPVDSSLYEIMLDQLGPAFQAPGVTGTINGGGSSPTGVWLSMSINRQWVVVTSGTGFDSNGVSGRVRIRLAATGVVQDEASLSILAEEEI